MTLCKGALSVYLFQRQLWQWKNNTYFLKLYFSILHPEKKWNLKVKMCHLFKQSTLMGPQIYDCRLQSTFIHFGFAWCLDTADFWIHPETPLSPPFPKTVVLPSPEWHIWKDTYIAKCKLWEATQSQDTGLDTGRRTESERVLLYAIHDKHNWLKSTSTVNTWAYIWGNYSTEHIFIHF